MLCHCIKDDNFAFTIDYKSDYLVYTDYSDWLSNPGSIIEDYDLTITNYTNNVSKDFKVKANLSTIIKYEELPIEKDLSCPPDGIFKFAINVCQGTQEYCKINAILINSQKAYEYLVREDKWDDAFEVLKYLEYVKVFANGNDIKKSLEYYEILQKLLKKIKCNCDGWSLQMYKSCS